MKKCDCFSMSILQRYRGNKVFNEDSRVQSQETAYENVIFRRPSGTVQRKNTVKLCGWAMGRAQGHMYLMLFKDPVSV